MITPITQEEFGSLGRWGTGSSPMPETIAARTLMPLTGFKVPCRWNHMGKSKHCSGASGIQAAVRRHCDFRVATRCKDGILYISRYA